MELVDGIRHIIDGNAIIIMGAGASFGAKNAFGDFPSGSLLAKELYQKCGITTPDDQNDLQDAAQSYEEKFSSMALISEIRTLLTCASFTKAHESIYSLPWMRYYTTNYDEVALLAARKNGVVVTPVTISSNLKNYLDKENLCVYINGYIGNLNEHTLHGEFKLTANSYLSQENILNSQWGDYLVNDLNTAKCIVILGLSLKYDLDLSKIIFNAAFKDKTIVIGSPNMTANSENRLSRFGKVYKKGVNGFAEEINTLQLSYTPRKKHLTDKLYTAFDYEYHHNYSYSEHKPDDVFRLYLNGQYNDSLFYLQKGSNSGLIHRTIFNDINRAVLSGKRFTFVHSDMGNGKTAYINQLRYRLSKEDIYVFTLSNADSKKIREEIVAIYSLSKATKVVVIIDDYPTYSDVLQKFALLDNSQVQFVLTARSALNYSKMPSILTMFNVQEDCSAVFDINKLSREDIKYCALTFDQYGLWGKRAKLTELEKIRYLASSKGGAGKFQSIMLDIIQSDLMQKKIIRLVKTIMEETGPYHNTIILILLVKIMNLRLSVLDIQRIANIDITTDALFRSNPIYQELIDFSKSNALIIKSPVTARFILQKVSQPESIIHTLISLVLYAQKFSDSSKFNNVLTTIVSYSHINSFLRGFNHPEQFLLKYYDEISQIDYYKYNNFFWLQYAISCIEIKRFDRAQRYLKTAYGLIPDEFVPFQINNQQARLYLELIDNGITDDPKNIFQSAHELLMVPVKSPKDNEYSTVRLFGYYFRKRVKKTMLSSDYRSIYKDACRDAFNRIYAFVKHYPIYETEFKDMQKSLLKIAVLEEFS